MKVIAAIILAGGLFTTEAFALGPFGGFRSRSCGGPSVFVQSSNSFSRVRIRQGFRNRVNVQAIPTATQFVSGSSVIVPQFVSGLQTIQTVVPQVVSSGVSYSTNYSTPVLRSDLPNRVSGLAEELSALRQALAPLQQQTKALTAGQ